MPELVTDCPRCATKRITFTVLNAHMLKSNHPWKDEYEAFCVCRHCQRSTTFILSSANPTTKKYISNSTELIKVPGSLNFLVDVDRYLSVRDVASVSPPEHLPPKIAAVFREGATCRAVACYNAAATMFRLCLDLATRDKLPPPSNGDTEGPAAPNYKTRRDLGLRLPWLFANEILPEDLRDLSHTVKEDGNDGAHAGTMTAEDVDDLLDFTTALLERMYTEPARLSLARERRDARRRPVD